MDKLFVVIPAYNEEKNIKKVVNDWYKIVEKYGKDGSKLVVINDGTKDNTYKILKEMAKDKELLTVLTKSNSGHGPTIIYGYKYALKNDADYIFQTDSDGQTNPEEFEKFWNERNDYDAIFGNRINRADGKQRVFVEKTLCRILKHYFKVNIQDSNAPFRLMTREYLKKYLPMIDDNYNLPNVMLTTFGAYYNDKIKFEEITFKTRQGGKNSLNIKKIIRIGINALKDFKKFQMRMENEKNI